MAINMESVTANLQAELSETPFACTSLTPLSGGNANFVFRGRLRNPLSSSPPKEGEGEILIKHGESFVRQNTSFSLPTSRCEVEATTLSILGEHLPPCSITSGTTASFTVRTPKLHHFNSQTNTQIQEFLPQGIDLKTYCLKYYEPATSRSKRPQCLALGKSLGSWLRELHTWTGSSSPAQKSLHDQAKRNQTLKLLKNATYYEYLAHQMVDAFPGVLGPSRELFGTLEGVAAKELEDDETLQVVHGDFWTGNVLLPDRDIPATDDAVEPGTGKVPVPVFVVDWEVTTLGIPIRDVGQMIAELHMLSSFRNITAGEWVIEGFLEGYGKLATEKEGFRTLIHIGAHLVVIGGTVAGWPEEGKDEHVERERVVKFGRDMIVRGWEEDRGWFEENCAVLIPLLDAA